jgi:hypothetical protein
MARESQRTMIRALCIGLQWIAVTTVVGALAIRSDVAFERLITPHLGAGVMFVGAFVGAALLGLTVESPKALGALVLAMCVVSASFVALVLYAPVWEGIIVRTTALDNLATQRAMILALLMAMAALPGAALGNLAGGWLNPRHEILADPRDVGAEEQPWWERRSQSSPE